MGLFTSANTTHAASATDKAAEYNKILAQYYYQDQMRAVDGIDLTAMDRFTLDGSSKAGAAMTSGEKVTYGVTAANTQQLELKLAALTNGLKGNAYLNMCDLVPLLFKYVDKGVSTYADLLILKTNVEEIKKRNPGQERNILDKLFTPLRNLFDTDDWVQRIITGSEYGLLVSWTTLNNMLDRYVKLFKEWESNDPKRKPTYGSYINLMDPLTTAYAAWKLDKTNADKALKRSTFEEVSEEVDVFYFLGEFDKRPGCTFNQGNPSDCTDFTLYNYKDYYPTINRFEKAPNRVNLVQVRNISQKIYSKLEELKVLGNGKTTPSVVAGVPEKLAMYKKYYKELKAIHFTNWQANRGLYRTQLLEWYGRFFWAFYGYEKQYKMLFDNFAQIDKLYLDKNFISFLMYTLGNTYEAYENAADATARSTTDSIEIQLSITYWYLNSGKYDAYSTITYAFDTLPQPGTTHKNQLVKLKFFKDMLVKSYKQKDIFLLKAGLEEVSDQYMKLYDPEYV